MIAVHQVDITLGDLEEIAIRLERCEVDVEDKVAVGRHFNLRRLDIERVFALIPCLLVNNWQ